eukprot:gnl/TRDRNA2_/TRDRNA2_181278_c0_seq1.p1 gnl/TRDRNA2_/TRDRNA2_181278_c0~~gnl/TRDRNA2_/TRDRNA2_181278_c0_seq1.p1  ORF type:complete len:329 (+),score=92.38 gnl/TRDRNA2_/TRDRNA2_181278_c0_seq1:88-1074(+)
MGDDWVPLTHEILCQCLSKIELAVGGGGFAFTHLDCSSKELTDLGNKVQDYKQLRTVVLSENKLSDITAVTQLPHLLTLRATGNQVAKAGCLQEAALPWCQSLDLSKNKLVSLPPLRSLGRLRFANFSENEIASLEDFGGHEALEDLDLQSNQLVSLKGLGPLPKLRRLVLTGNQLTSLEGLDVATLTKLDLSGNQLASLEHIGGAPCVTELNISGNQLPGPGEDESLPEIRRLGLEAPKLKTVMLAGNPFADTLGDGLKVEMVVYAPQLKTVEGEPVTEEDFQAAKAREVELEAKAKEVAAALAAAKAEEEAAAAAAAAEEAGEGGE